MQSLNVFIFYEVQFVLWSDKTILKNVLKGSFWITQDSLNQDIRYFTSRIKQYPIILGKWGMKAGSTFKASVTFGIVSSSGLLFSRLKSKTSK